MESRLSHLVKNRHKYMMAAYWSEVDVDLHFNPPKHSQELERAVLEDVGYL